MQLNNLKRIHIVFNLYATFFGKIEPRFSYFFLFTMCNNLTRRYFTFLHICMFFFDSTNIINL